MTSKDDTAHACPPVCNESDAEDFPFSEKQLYPLTPEQEQLLTRTSRVAGVLLAVTTIDGLLAYSDACKRARLPRKRNTVSPWPLVPSQVSGLSAALYYLREYVSMLPPDSDG